VKRIGQQIQYEKNGKNQLSLEINPVLPKSKKSLLFLWGLSWTICGLIIFGALFFSDFKKEEYLGVGIFLIFWTYFEFKVVHAIRWNAFGKEILHIKDGEFSYLKSISERGFPQVVEVSKLSAFRFATDSESGLWSDINKSSWFVGGEVVEYQSDGSVKRIGMKLSKKDALQLVNLLNKTAGL
jgi:hypothetical protein